MRNNPFILIAEDDPDDQLLIRDAMRSACPPDIEARYVEDGVELMDFLQGKTGDHVRPRLLVLDLNMPRKDGRMALHEIKSDPGLANLPVVILTTSNTEEDIRYCQRYGIAGYYRKPSLMSELRAIFQKLCIDYLS